MANNKGGELPEITKMHTTVDPLPAPEASADLLAWLGKEGREQLTLKFLLATTYDGVVWGKRNSSVWTLSDGAGTLPAASLLELRAFGPEDEIFVWRDAEGLRARHRHDRGGKERDSLVETQLLWGTEPARKGKAPDGFTALQDGDAGLKHAPPLVFDDSHFNGIGHRPARLYIRHYIERDDNTGIARIDDSRLIDLTVVPAPQKEEKDGSQA